jgi:hypothetical protein
MLSFSALVREYLQRVVAYRVAQSPGDEIVNENPFRLRSGRFSRPMVRQRLNDGTDVDWED